MVSLLVSLRMNDFPNSRQNPWLVLPLLASIAGTVDHVRCMKREWSWYHGGVLLLIYTDIMIVGLILFFLLYPYAQWLTLR